MAAPSSGQGWLLSSMHMMDLHCLAGHRWASLTWPYHAPARPCVAGTMAPHMCQCPEGLWLFDTALGKVVHPRNCEGYPGAACKFGHEQGMTNQGDACLFLSRWLLPLGHAWHWGAGRVPPLSSEENLPNLLHQQQRHRERCVGSSHQLGFHG